MNNTTNGSLSPNSRYPVTLGDFIKTRKSKNHSSPEILRKPSPGNYRSPGVFQRNLFSRENQIDFSVNDTVFEKVENPLEEEMRWSENDVDFTPDQNPCSYRHCLKNDSGFKAFNSFRLNSYSSEEFDINFNNEHFYLPDQQQYTEYGTTYFPFDRVEDDTSYYYGTTFDQGDDIYYEQEAGEEYQVVPGAGHHETPESELSVIETLMGLNISTEVSSSASKAEICPVQETFDEKDEELNNLVLSIIGL